MGSNDFIVAAMDDSMTIMRAQQARIRELEAALEPFAVAPSDVAFDYWISFPTEHVRRAKAVWEKGKA